MDWTKHETQKKQFITIEEALKCLNDGNLSVNDVKEVINATIDDIIMQSGKDLKFVIACREFLNAIGYGNKEI